MQVTSKTTSSPFFFFFAKSVARVTKSHRKNKIDVSAFLGTLKVRRTKSKWVLRQISPERRYCSLSGDIFNCNFLWLSTTHEINKNSYFCLFSFRLLYRLQVSNRFNCYSFILYYFRFSARFKPHSHQQNMFSWIGLNWMKIRNGDMKNLIFYNIQITTNLYDHCATEVEKHRF